MASFVRLAAFINGETTSIDFANKLADFFMVLEESLTPTLYGFDESDYKRKFEFNDVLEDPKIILQVVQNRIPSTGESWESFRNLIWRHKVKGRSEGFLNHTSITDKMETVPGSLSIRLEWDDNVDFENLYRLMLEFTKPEFAYLHFFTVDELADHNVNTFFKRGILGTYFEEGYNYPYFGDVAHMMSFKVEYLGDRHDLDLKSFGFEVNDDIGELVSIRYLDAPSKETLCYENFSKNRKVLKELNFEKLPIKFD